MKIDVRSSSDCEALVERIQQTLATNGYCTSNLPRTPKPFPTDDNRVLEQLSEAILSIQSKWHRIRGILPALKRELLDYHVHRVAGLGDSYVHSLFTKYRGSVRFEKKLFAIRDNAEVFVRIASTTHQQSVCHFIKSRLPSESYDTSCSCYIRPADDNLLYSFTHPKSDFRLHQVQLATCCEFFKNIGIDEFKPDAHTMSFLNRVNIDRAKAKVSRNPVDVRQVGITIAQTLPQPRAFVDMLMWCLCAEREGEICTENDPKCHLCKLKDHPQLCIGYPGKTQIAANPLKAAARFQESNLTRAEAHKNMMEAGVPQGVVDATITKIYGARRRPRVKWDDIKQFIQANPAQAAELMQQAGLSYDDACEHMAKAGLASDEIEKTLKNAYSNGRQ